MNCAEFAWLYLTKSELRKICMIRGILGPQPGPEKVPLLVRIVRNLRHSWLWLANGAKFAQFASNFFYLSTKLTRTTVSLKVNRHFVSYDNSRLNYFVALIIRVISTNTIWPGHLLCMSCLFSNNGPISQQLLPIHSLFYNSWHFYDCFMFM